MSPDTLDRLSACCLCCGARYFLEQHVCSGNHDCAGGFGLQEQFGVSDKQYQHSIHTVFAIGRQAYWSTRERPVIEQLAWALG